MVGLDAKWPRLAKYKHFRNIKRSDIDSAQESGHFVPSRPKILLPHSRTRTLPDIVLSQINQRTEGRGRRMTGEIDSDRSISMMPDPRLTSDFQNL